MTVERAIKIVKHAFKERMFDSEMTEAQYEIASAIGHGDYLLINKEDFYNFLENRFHVNVGYIVDEYFDGRKDEFS